MKVSFGIGFGPPKRVEQLALTDYALRRFALGRGDLDRQRHELRLLGNEIMPHFAT